MKPEYLYHTLNHVSNYTGICWNDYILYDKNGVCYALTILVRELTGVPVHPLPWSSVSGTILFGGPSGIILAMLPDKKTGTHYYFRPFIKMAASKSEISNISEITSCRIMIWGSKPIFSWSRNQINTLYSMADLYYGCKRTQIMKKSKMAANFTLYFGKCVIALVLVAMKRWIWCLNLSFHVWWFR